MRQNFFPFRNPQTSTWPDLQGYVAAISPLTAAIDQCSIQREGRNLATLLLFQDTLVGMVDVKFHCIPDDTTHVAIGRTIRAHQRACDHACSEGGELL